MKKLLIAKYEADRTATGKGVASSPGGEGVCGSRMRKRCAATQIAVAAAQILNAARTFERRLPLAQLLRMIASRVVIMVAAEGPNKSTAANTNASDTEIRALIEGSLMLKEPVRNASPASTNHCGLGGETVRS